MDCRNCGNTAAYAVRTIVDGDQLYDSCNNCGGLTSIANSPDVYFKTPYMDENLSSQDHPGAKFISTKAEKVYWLKKCHLRESGDRVHGATSFDPISHRHAEESLRRK